MSRPRQTNLEIGSVYGIGSLTHATRTIVAMSNKGAQVSYIADESPITSAGTGRSRKAGKTYIVSRVSFLLWLRQVRKDDAALKHRTLAARKAKAALAQDINADPRPPHDDPNRP